MKIQQIHHVAYRCKDAKETVDFYTKYLNMEFMLAISEDKVPSTKANDPYMHLFLDVEMGTSSPFSNYQIPPIWGGTKTLLNGCNTLHSN